LLFCFFSKPADAGCSPALISVRRERTFANSERLYSVANTSQLMRLAKNIFEPKASRILRCLLLNPGRAWTTRELAGEAQVSLGYTHAVALALIQNGYLVRNEAYRLEVVDPIRLLSRWASYHQYTTANSFLDYYTFEREVDVLIGRLRSVHRGYALTTLGGAWLVVPHVRPVVVEAYVEDRKEAESMADELHLRPIPREGNVRLVIPHDAGIFYKAQTITDVIVVSNVQLYVDLYNYPARGEEAAGPVLNLIQKAWSQALLGGATRV